VRELTFDVPRGTSVLLMGPNGCGKSSLFRVMAGLWPLCAGEVSLPARDRVFYLSQRPYLVTGTLRDQLLYPHPPAAVWDATSPAAQVWARRGAGGGGVEARQGSWRAGSEAR
jgi:ATP-binding cassette subfamily D (ALD) protein 3